MSSIQNTIKQFAEIGKFISTKLNFQKLNDTPTGYLGHAGDYLVVNDNENAVNFTGVEKIASDLTDFGFGGGGGGSVNSEATNIVSTASDENGDSSNDTNNTNIQLQNGNFFITEEVVENGTWKLDLKQGSSNKLYMFDVAFKNVAPLPDNHGLSLQSQFFKFGWNGDFTVRTNFFQKNNQHWLNVCQGWPKGNIIGNFNASHQNKKITIKFRPERITTTNGLSIAQDSNGNNYVVPNNSDQVTTPELSVWVYLDNGYRSISNIFFSDGSEYYPYIYVYDVNGFVDLQSIGSPSYSFTSLDPNNFTDIKYTSYNSQTVVEEFTIDSYDYLNVMAAFNKTEDPVNYSTKQSFNFS